METVGAALVAADPCWCRCLLPGAPCPACPSLAPCCLQGLSEEEVQAAAQAAAEEAAANSDVQRAAAGALDAQERYYKLTHRCVSVSEVSPVCVVCVERGWVPYLLSCSQYVSLSSFG